MTKKCCDSNFPPHLLILFSLHDCLLCHLDDKQIRQRCVLCNDFLCPAACWRNDGTLVQMDGRALLFQSEVTEREAGLYTCQASFYHHQASVLIQVEVTSEDKQLSECTLTLSCISETTIYKIFQCFLVNIQKWLAYYNFNIIWIYFHLQQVFHSIHFDFVLPDVFLLCVCAVIVFIVCFSSAAAITILLIVTLCVFWWVDQCEGLLLQLTDRQTATQQVTCLQVVLWQPAGWQMTNRKPGLCVWWLLQLSMTKLAQSYSQTGCSVAGAEGYICHHSSATQLTQSDSFCLCV